MMKKYKVKIVETLLKEVTIEANNKDDAFGKVKKMYRNQEIILDNNDFVDVEFYNVDYD